MAGGHARNQTEVNCLLYAFAQADIACLLQQGFRVEVGGATTAEILRAAQQCLKRNGIERLRVELAGERKTEYVLQP